MRNGVVGIVGMAVVVALSAAGCATDGAVADDAPPGSGTAFATVPAPSTTEGEPAATVLSVPPTDSVAPSDDPSVGNAPSTVAPTDEQDVASAGPPDTVQPADTVEPADDGQESVGDLASDDPSFDIGPPVELDVDLARFPTDDAGQGGTVGQPEAADEAETVTGWLAVDRYLESVLIGPGNTSASYAVSIGGDIVHAAAFGVRNPSSGEPTTPDDRFRIASISKTISAITAMSLVEDGMVGLDDPVGQTIADHLGVAVAGGSRSLTLRQLLTHRSGLGKYDSAFFRKGAQSCEDAARAGLASGASGGGYTYSNMNYCLVGLLIEALTGLSYEQAVYSILLTPLGISGMRLPPTVDPGPGEVQHQTSPGRNYMETLGAAGSWIASPSDLVTIFDSLDLSTPGFKPLGQESVFEMVVPAGAQYGQRGYGLGVISYGDGRFGHTGTIESTHAMLLNRGDGVTWAITVAGSSPSESTALERIMNRGFEAGGFVDGG